MKNTYNRQLSLNVKLAVFYDLKSTINGGGWNLSGFINHENHDIIEVIFIQGVDQKHDSFHVLYKECQKNENN